MTTIEHGEDGHTGFRCLECAEQSGIVITSERPLAAQVDWAKKSDQHNHGEIGHIGYRCGMCAQLSDKTVRITRNSIDYWQTVQIEWQEECDEIMAKFQRDVQTHFPDHQPANCKSCPVQGILPEKPLPPIERALKQIQSQ